ATDSNGQTLFYKEEGFKDAYRLALGTTYYYDDNWTSPPACATRRGWRATVNAVPAICMRCLKRWRYR
ncbi:hypothetical protein FK514_29315, partial [Klebsiella pneumoniae]